MEVEEWLGVELFCELYRRDGLAPASQGSPSVLTHQSGLISQRSLGHRTGQEWLSFEHRQLERSLHNAPLSALSHLEWRRCVPWPDRDRLLLVNNQ